MRLKHGREVSPLFNPAAKGSQCKHRALYAGPPIALLFKELCRFSRHDASRVLTLQLRDYEKSDVCRRSQQRHRTHTSEANQPFMFSEMTPTRPGIDSPPCQRRPRTFQTHAPSLARQFGQANPGDVYMVDIREIITCLVTGTASPGGIPPNLVESMRRRRRSIFDIRQVE